MGFPPSSPIAGKKKNIIALLEKVDGILISGGHGHRSAPVWCASHAVLWADCTERDEYDLTIFHYGYEHKLPMLGICRGIQIMNVAMGGTVYQDLGQEAHLTHRYMGDMAPKNYPSHETLFLQVPFSIQLRG